MDEGTEQRLLARIAAYESTAELNPFKERCVRCGRVAAGYAYVGDDRLCHPDDPDREDCYELEQWGVPRPVADSKRDASDSAERR